MVRPVYPKVARQGRVEGIVILEAKVDEQGNVIDARLLRSIPVLDQAAVDAVKQWKYEPMVVDGKPRKALITVTVRFMLDEAENRAMSKFAQGAVRAEGDIKPPMLVKEVPAVYPEVARLARVQGVVILGVKTDERGKVIDVIVLRSIPLLDQAAIDAVRQWTYEPLVVEGKAVPAVFTATVRFKLQESPLIKPGDTLDIDVNGLPDFRAACQVSAAGSITYRMLGDVRVDNLSLDEAGERLARLLKPYLREPRVTMTFGQAPAKKFPAP